MFKNEAPQAPSLSFVLPEDAIIVLSKTIEERILSAFKKSPELLSSLLPVPAPVANGTIEKEEDPNFIYYTTDEVAQRLRCSISTVRSLCKSKKLGSSKPAGKDILVSKAQLHDYCSKQNLSVA